MLRGSRWRPQTPSNSHATAGGKFGGTALWNFKKRYKKGFSAHDSTPAAFRHEVLPLKAHALSCAATVGGDL